MGFTLSFDASVKADFAARTSYRPTPSCPKPLGRVRPRSDGRRTTPGQAGEMHQDFREFMRDKGYDVELERRKPGKHAKRLSESEYKDWL